MWRLGVVLWSLLEVNLYSSSVLGPRLVAVVESSEVGGFYYIVLMEVQSGAVELVALERLVSSRRGR